MLAEPNILNYSTKRGYIVALRQDNNQMQVDAELEAAGYTSKSRAKKFNKVWHPYLPREVSAMQWLILTEGLPVGAWRAKIGLPSDCQLCPAGTTETLQHAFQDCPEVKQAWVLLNNTRVAAGLRPAYITWLDISRGLMQEPEGPSVEDDLRWDTTVVFSNNNDTPWDILRAQLLWAIWCQRVAHAFSDEVFHLGVALWNVWRNTIYCAIEAYKELFRHKRNEEKRQELISCFQQIWTASNIFGRLRGEEIKWNITPPDVFLPRELGAWLVPPIRVHRPSPSPNPEATFTARPDFPDLVSKLVNNIGNNLRPHVAEEARSPVSPHQVPLNPASADEPVPFDLQQTLKRTTHMSEVPHRPSEHAASTSQAAKPTSRPKHWCRRSKIQGPTTSAGDAAAGILTARNAQETRPRAESPDAHLSGQLPHLSDQENQPPRACHTTISNPSTVGVKAKSRSKVRCKFGPNKVRIPSDAPDCSTQAQGLPVHPPEPPDNEELDALLLEIDSVRRQGGLSAPAQPNCWQVNHTQRDRRQDDSEPPALVETASPRTSHPRSRPKVKCTFGPLKCLGGVPQTPPFRPYVTQTTTSGHDAPCRVQPPTIGLSPVLSDDGGHVPSTSANQTCDRVTLAPHFPVQASFMDRFRASAAPAPQLNPHRFKRHALGISQEEFDVHVAREVIEALTELAEERRRAREPTPPAADLSPPLVPLSKDECLRRFFPGNVRPTTGPMLGVFSWALDLGSTRFNFDFNFDTDDVMLLNAYD